MRATSAATAVASPNANPANVKTQRKERRNGAILSYLLLAA